MNSFLLEEIILAGCDFGPPPDVDVWILGRKYNLQEEEEEIKKDVRSKIWITYRRNFPRIGGSGPSSDYGWGCMLRCGQMVMAQALINKHFGRDWRWTSKEEMIEKNQYRTYLRILSLFLDQKSATYSIHQIAQMGASEGKPVGHWFGPNTVAQAIRKLAEYDKWNELAVHVSLDNIVIIDDIKSCTYSAHNQTNSHHQPHHESDQNDCDSQSSSHHTNWPDLILFIPLRLGLSEINTQYSEQLKSTFRIKQSLGIIGGRPNHALYFFGYIGDDLIYLDPHTTQPALDYDVENIVKCSPRELSSLDLDDSSYHQDSICRMPLEQLDPSIGLCFHFPTELDFDSWCVEATDLLINGGQQPLFEIFKEKPFPTKHEVLHVDTRQAPSEYDTGNLTPECMDTTNLDFEKRKETNDVSSDEEFEILTADS